MASTWYQTNPNRANSAFQDDPFDDVSEQLDGAEVIDLTAVDEVELDHPQQPFSHVNKSLRNHALDGDHQSVNKVAVNGNNYEVGHFVELRELVGVHGIEFVETKSINVHKRTGDVIIRGLPYARARYLHGCLPRKRNEVCLILEIDACDARPDEEQALLEIGPEEILKKRILTNTNKSFPDCRFDKVAYVTEEQQEKQAPLTCRWKMRAVYKDVSQRRAGRLQGQTLEHFSERDGDKIKRRNLGVDKDRSLEWRGETILGGSTFGEVGFIIGRPEFTTVEWDFVKGEPVDGKGEPEDSKLEQVQKYSFADISAGAGGASSGAHLASFEVVLATEPCLHACASYRANFPTTELYRMEATEVATDEDQYPVDALHISPSALSTAGDDKEAVKKLCTGLLKKFHPRFLILEQPATILSERKVPLLNAIINSLTEAGYSMQWKIVNMVEYGLPQMRKRLIMIGAGPGETLPSWPAVTHALDPTSYQPEEPFYTEEQAIDLLTPGRTSLHNPDTLRVINRAARDPDKPLDCAINASGSVYPHPDGKREFTLRELACLQGFPGHHEFKGSYIKKQIGTAFPPVVATEFYVHLREHMEEVDGVLTQQSREVPSASDTPDEAMPGAMVTVHSNEHPARSASRQRTEVAVPRLTVSPEIQKNAGPKSPSPQPPSPAQLPTPSTSGHFIAGQRAAALRLKRERAVFEETEGDGDDDDSGGPLTLQAPSKHPRTSSISRERTRSFSRSSSRTVSSLPDDATGSVEDVSVSEDAPVSEDANGQGGRGLDGEMPQNTQALLVMARESRRDHDDDGEV